MNADGTPRFQLQLLGPARLLVEGRPRPLKTRKSLALLMLLAVGGTQGRARLGQWLWPRLDEASARRNLRRELVRLREAGAADAVQVDADRLQPGPELGHDLARAEALLAAGRPEAALALWRGEVAEGLEGDDDDDTGLTAWLSDLRQRAQALRRGVQEAIAEAAEARGDLDAALAGVRALLADDALQERQHRAAMRLLAAQGQREAALRQFEACRALLAADLGLAPTPETVALAESLRGQVAPSPAAPAAPPPADALPVPVPERLPFVGRTDEVARMQRAWSQCRPLLLVGEAGLGKTRLAADFAASQGPHALLRAQAGDHELPLATFTRALRELAGEPPDLSALEPWVVAELARLLPELGPAPPPLRHADDRRRFDEACLRAWQALAGASFDSVVLDDWQWADSASRTLLASASARRRAGGGALEILTWRGDRDDTGLPALAEAFGAEIVALPALDEAAVQDLVRQLSGVDQPVRFARRLCSATGGHPFFIAETLRDLAERALLRHDGAGRWFTPFDDDADGYLALPLAATVRDAVLARVRRLGAACARLLEAAALASEPLRVARLAPACALSELEALAALDEAARAQLVTLHDGGGYGWSHDLARQALASALEPTRRRLLHHRLALAAEAQGAHAEAARHFEDCGEPARAWPHRLAAGDAALALQALDEVAIQWQRGLEDAPTAAEEVPLLARLCLVQWQQGQGEAAQRTHARLQASLGHEGLAAETRVDAQLRAAEYLTSCGEQAQSLALLESMPPPAGHARLRWSRQRANALHQLGRLDEAMAEGRQALQAAAAGSRDRAEVLLSLATLAHASARMSDAVAHADESIRLFDRLGDPMGRARGLFYRGIAQIERGHLAEAEADLRSSADLAARHGNVYLQRMVLYNLAATFSNQSRPVQALAVAQQAWPSLSETPGEEIALVFRSMFIECHFQLGDWGPMWDHLEPAVEAALARQQPMTLMCIANCATEPAALLGRWDRVEPLLQALDAVHAFDELPLAAEIALICVHAARLRGDRAAAAAWLARVHPAGEAEHPRVRCRAELLRVEQALDDGAGPAALERLPADDAPGMHPELRLRALLPRWRAGVLPRERLLAALDDPQAHAGVSLQLARELGGAVYAQRRAQVAAGLAAWPDLQRSFLAAWP